MTLLLGQLLLTAGTASAIDLDNLSQLQKQQLSACPRQAQNALHTVCWVQRSRQAQQASMALNRVSDAEAC